MEAATQMGWPVRWPLNVYPERICIDFNNSWFVNYSRTRTQWHRQHCPEDIGQRVDTLDSLPFSMNNLNLSGGGSLGSFKSGAVGKLFRLAEP